MKFIFYDVETTGLSSKDEVIQFAAIVVENGMVIETKNFYCYTQMQINPKAARANGLNKEKLKFLSGGKFFEDYWREWKTKDEKELCWIAYSKGNFDVVKINHTLSHNGLPSHNFGKQIDTLADARGVCYFDVYKYRTRQGIKGSRKLIDEVNRVGITLQGAQNAYKRAFGDDKDLHDAEFDAFILMLFVGKLKLLGGN